MLVVGHVTGDGGMIGGIAGGVVFLGVERTRILSSGRRHCEGEGEGEGEGDDECSAR